VIVAPLRTRFGVTTRPHTGIDGIPGGTGLERERTRRDERFQTRQIHGAGVEGIIEPAPPTLAGGCQTQVRGRFETRCAQRRVEDFKQGVAPTPKQRVDFVEEGSQRFHFWRVHNQKDERSSASCLPHPSRALAVG